MEDGLFLEFGVYKGTSINFISSLIPDKKIYGFDSFGGLPEEWVPFLRVTSARMGSCPNK